MNILNISRRQFLTLQKYQLPNSVSNTESELFVINSKDKWKKQRYLLKKLYIDQGEQFGNKLLTVNTLIDNKEDIGIQELVFPEKLVVLDKKIVGFTYPLIEDSVNLSCLLSDLNIPIEQKIKYLKQVGRILRKVQKVTKYKNNFFLGDVHESNCIVELESDKVSAVDLDSCTIANNRPFPSRYLDTNKNIKNLQIKYPINNDGIHIPNADTEWMCYILMVLNTIANGPVYSMPMEEYFLYLNYLRSLGFPNELLDCFSKIYINCSNESPEELLDLIPDKIGQACFSVFKYKTKNKKRI